MNVDPAEVFFAATDPLAVAFVDVIGAAADCKHAAAVPRRRLSGS